MPNLKIHLNDPIDVHGTEVRVLDLRTPTTAEVTRFGFPFKICPDGSFIPLAEKILRYVILLAKIPRSSALQISAADFSGEAMPEILSLFGQDTQNPEESTNG